MPSKISVFALTAAFAVVLSIVASPAFADATTVNVSGAAVGSSSISVTGSVVYGTDATGTLVLGTDPSGDATPPAPGMDLTGVSVRPDIAGKKLIWTLSTGNGLPDPVGGPAPAMMGYMVPISVDEEDWWRWLGAGTAGSNIAATGKWTGLCSNEIAGGTQGGWGCPGTLAGAGTYSYTGSITASGVTWTQPFGQMKPQIQYGSVVAPSSIHCGGPCTFVWPSGLLGSAAPIDAMSMDSYKVPGEVLLAVAPAGTTPTSSAFATKALFNGTTGAFSGSLTKPASAGAYTVWAKTCFGKAEEATCSIGSTDITI